jgi:hypothetical protein
MVVLRCLTFLIAIQILIGLPAQASKPWTLEGLLKRAETIAIVETQLQIGPRVNLRVIDQWRGLRANEFNLELSGGYRKAKMIGGSKLFLFSQGDNYWGGPIPILILRQETFGQSSYRGWIAHSLPKRDRLQTLERKYSKQISNSIFCFPVAIPQFHSIRMYKITTPSPAP